MIGKDYRLGNLQESICENWLEKSTVRNPTSGLPKREEMLNIKKRDKKDVSACSIFAQWP